MRRNQRVSPCRSSYLSKTLKPLVFLQNICYNSLQVNSREERTTIKNNSRTKLNGEIRYESVRVIGSNGEQLGIMSSREAQLLAKEQGVDLVEIAANANPPVVKIIDWGKYQYQKMKEEAKNRKKAREKQSELKQMKIGLKISDNDLNIKVRKMRSFLDDGDRVKIMIIFKGREMAHKEIGNELLSRVISMLGEDVITEGKTQMSGRNLSVQVRKK
ncbi:translation initiation factor IF-3 [Candidatus Saccharibacteria bacterium]|nr:translation initiation factor IF-3 [Candidatus Saccharibacteria bacterium]